MALGVGVLLPFLATSLIFLHPLAATEEALSPMLSPMRNETCADVFCGKGSCKADRNGSFPFRCECEPGWKQFQFHVDDNYFIFTPCVIPTCTLNFSCMYAPPPTAAPPLPPHNHSFFDPCTWGYCGEGTCMKISTFRHRCICSEGYANLLNISAFPCFSQCTFGEDCSEQGVGLTNSSSSARPTLSDSGRAVNNACSGFSRTLLQMIILGISLATVPWL